MATHRRTNPAAAVPAVPAVPVRPAAAPVYYDDRPSLIYIVVRALVLGFAGYGVGVAVAKLWAADPLFPLWACLLFGLLVVLGQEYL
jgi:hypothetical protein